MLNSHREILDNALSDLSPLQIVVLGQESTGKSSILERLAMMTLFPRAEIICTRVPIHVRLRNSAEAAAPTIEVFNERTGATEDGPHLIPMQWGAVEVSETVEQVLRREQASAGGGGADRIVVVRIAGPLVPSVDLVDLPGLVSAPRDLAAQALASAEQHIARHGGHSLFLAVVPAGENPRNSAAMALLEAHGLQGRTLGVLTMCDELPERRLGALRRQLGLEPAAGGADGARAAGGDLAPHGWVAVASPPVAGAAGRAERRRAQAEEERALFERALPGAAALGRASCAALVGRLRDVHLRFAAATWAPGAVRGLDAAIADARAAADALGPPPVAGDAGATRGMAAGEARRFLEARIAPLARDAGRSVLDPLRCEIAAVELRGLGGVPAQDVEEVLGKRRRALEEVCRQGAEDWAAHLRRALRRELGGARAERRALGWGGSRSTSRR